MRDEAAVWGRFSGKYDALMKRDMPVYRQIMQKVSLLLAPESIVLEIGTGTGIFALGIAKSAKYVEAVDFSPHMIAKARRKCQQQGVANVRFSLQDVCALRYNAQLFDAAIVCNTLHIMPQPEKALEEIKRVLKPGGLCIAPTYLHAQNAKTAVVSRIMTLTGFRAYHRWTQQSYCRFLESNGFEIAHAELLRASFPIVFCCCRVR